MQPGNMAVTGAKILEGPRCAYSSLIYKKAAGSDIAELICSGMPRRAL